MSREVDAILHFFFLFLAIFMWFRKASRSELTYFSFLGIFLIISFVFDGAAVFIMFNRQLAVKFNSNLFLYHFAVPLQFSSIILIYYYSFKSARFKIYSKFSILFFIGCSICLSIWIQPLYEYNSYSILLKHLIVILTILFYFYETIVEMPYKSIYTQPLFWISVGFLFHASFNIFLEGASNYLESYSKMNTNLVYILYSITNYLLFIIITIGTNFINKVKKG